MSGKHWISEPSGYLEPKIGKSGYEAVPAKTVVQVFQDCIAAHGDKNALFLKRAVNGKLPEEWNQIWTWQKYYDDCCKFARTLIHLDVAAFKITNILGFNSPEWCIANNGSLFASCIAAGIYATNTAEACHYITQHSHCEVVVLDGNKQLEKYINLTAKDYPSLKALVVYAEDVLDQAIVAKCNFPVYLWSAFLELGAGVSQAALEKRMSSIKCGNCSTLIYTSGTTGPPKAVMISHDNITWTAKSVADHYFDLSYKDRIISFLPMSHIAAQLFDIHVPIYLGCSVYFCQPDALKGSLTVTMREVRPTLFFSVPRVWEKIQEKMAEMGRKTTGIKKMLVTWSKGLGSEHSRLNQFGNAGGAPLGFGCAHSLILSKIKETLGLDQVKGAFTAAAPISIDTLNYFASLDIPVYEVFGQSECTGPHTVSSPGNWKIGSCGRPMRGTVTKIVASNGELCYKGRHVFMGYMYMPDKSAETIDEDGFLHSGDVAELDADNDPLVTAPSGFMKITGRIKELIITAGGENVPPVLIEDAMKGEMLALSNCMVIGDMRKYLAMVISLKTVMDTETGGSTDALAPDSLHVGKQIGSTAETLSAAKKDPLWIKYLNDGMKAANKKTTSNAQIVQKWALLPSDFTEKGGELTPTMKLKRSVAAEKYSDLIEEMYKE